LKNDFVPSTPQTLPQFANENEKENGKVAIKKL